MSIQESELILNSDGSVYHLSLKPENISDTIILVGDQDRVERITKYFDDIEFSIQKREFKTQTGTYKKRRITVLSTGIGGDNIDIVMNELDALVNIDLTNRKPKKELTCLNIIRIGTSGSLNIDLPVDSFVLSDYGLDLTGLLHFYKLGRISHSSIENVFVNHTHWSTNKAKPIIIRGSTSLEQRLKSELVYIGTTVTTGGFYGPQGRTLRLPLADYTLNEKIDTFEYADVRILNFEMETAVIYGLAALLGHNAISLSAIVANRVDGTFSKDPQKVVDELIAYTLKKLSS